MLREMGLDITITPQLEEFFMLTNKISTLADSDGKAEGNFESPTDNSNNKVSCNDSFMMSATVIIHGIRMEHYQNQGAQ